MSVAHFYHLYASGFWRNPLAEHLAALEDAGYDGPMFVGVVGGPRERAEAISELHALRPVTIVAEADTGWEQVTLRPLRAHAREHDGLTLYAHTKGSARPSIFQDTWRQSMTHHLVLGWQAAATALEQCEDLDAVGCHWLTAEQFPHVQAETAFPMFGGNFWLARNSYLRTLPPVSTASRHEAEAWIGLGSPRVLDLTPGWPGHTPFPRRKMRRLIAGRAT